MSGGVGGWRGAIPVTRPDRGRPPHIAAQNAGYLSQADTPMMKVGAAWWGGQSWRAILAAACFRAWKAALVMAAACVSAAIRPRVDALPMGNREFMSRN
jgi:hypothetical protein